MRGRGFTGRMCRMPVSTGRRVGGEAARSGPAKTCIECLAPRAGDRGRGIGYRRTGYRPRATRAGHPCHLFRRDGEKCEIRVRGMYIIWGAV